MTITTASSRRKPLAVVSVVLVVLLLVPQAVQAQAAQAAPVERAQRAFYSGDYAGSAALAQELCTARPDDLEACELRTASLLFQIKKALGDLTGRDKTVAWNACASCPVLMTAFVADTARSQAFARARLMAHPDDEAMLFFLGKVDLNFVWLQLGTLGRKTGWNEYWEARKSLDRVLQLNPAHVRGRVARAWVDYIVGTSVPRGVRWMLGGGNKKHGLLVVREVAANGGDGFDQVEAMFALWDMQVREREFPAAVVTARSLVRDFPENRDLREFLTRHGEPPAAGAS